MYPPRLHRITSAGSPNAQVLIAFNVGKGFHRAYDSLFLHSRSLTPLDFYVVFS